MSELPSVCLVLALNYLPMHQVVDGARLVNKEFKESADVAIRNKLTAQGVKGKKLAKQIVNATCFKLRNEKVKAGLEKSKTKAMERARTNPSRNRLIETQQLPLTSNHFQIRNIRALVDTPNLHQIYQVVAQTRLGSPEVVGLDLSDSPLKARVKISVYKEELAQMRQILALGHYDATTTSRLMDKTLDCLPSLERIENEIGEWALITFLPRISTNETDTCSYYDQFVADTAQPLSSRPLKTYGVGRIRDSIGVDLKNTLVFLRVNKLALPDIYRKGIAKVDEHTRQQMTALRNL